MAMRYNITDKLKFGEDPVLQIRDVELTIRSDADIVLQILDIFRRKGEIEAALEAVDLLFSGDDKAKLDAMNLKIADYVTVITTAVTMALGEDPDEDEEKEKN